MRERTAKDLEKLARYAVGRYRLGYRQLSLFLAGELFENIINRKLNRQTPPFISDKLEEKINHLNGATILNDSLFCCSEIFKYFVDSRDRSSELSNNESQRAKQVIDRLHNFRKLRNQVMHGNEIPDMRDNRIEEFICYIWRELAPDSFNMALKHHEPDKNLTDVLLEHSADYMVRDIDEIEIKLNDEKLSYKSHEPHIVAKDFANLYELRRKMVPLKNRMKDWLKSYDLNTDILTTIDTTSAYIWMPFTRNESSKRSGILNCSVSILATPLDFRIYMDFGGNASKERRLYYEFLDDSPEYLDVIKGFSDKKNFFVFDTEWYCFLSQQESIGDCKAEVKQEWIRSALKDIAPYSDPPENPITWNRMLHGYIITRNEIKDAGKLDFKSIEPKLKDIIVFFKAFEKYRKRNPEPCQKQES